MAKHKIAVVISVNLVVEAETYRGAVQLVNETLQQPGAFQVLGADTERVISVEGIGQAPKLNLDAPAPPPATPGVHALEVHSLSVEAPTRFR